MTRRAHCPPGSRVLCIPPHQPASVTWVTPGRSRPVSYITMPDSLHSPCPPRADALTLMHQYTASESLRKHMLAVEAAMRSYAATYDGDADRWGVCGLLHDFDYERWPNAAHSATEEHPAEGVRILRGLGYPEDICEAILGHASYSGVARVTPMARALFAVDELTGLITATALVKPTRSVHDVDAASVRKKMKDKGFARGVNRDDVIGGAAELGVDLDTHIARVIDAMRGASAELGLSGQPVG